MSAINNVAQDLWYRTPGKDRRLSRRISAELYRFEQIEKAARALVDYTGSDAGKIGELKKEIRRALKLSTEIEP